MMTSKDGGRLLLLDLDGVVVFEVGMLNAGTAVPAVTRQIILLHEDLPRRLRQLSIPVAVLTHRSRREALQILRVAGFEIASLAGIYAAEDIFKAGLSPRLISTMARRGLRKSLILDTLSRQLGILPESVAFVDDVFSNLEDMEARGLGLAMHAPSAIDATGTSLVTFEMEQAFEALNDWRPGTHTTRRLSLHAVEVEIEGWRLTGLETTDQARHPFNRARRLGTIARAALFRRG